MKKIQSVHFPLLIISMVIFAGACSKSGSTGPAGPTGPAGAAGAAGPAGQNGSVIYSGTTAPASTLGNIGDFYLNLSNSMLYGPKTASGWGTPISLQGAAGAAGATGAAGAAGSQIYSGTTAPASSLGTIGDYYLNKTGYLLYGPKTASGWGTPIALQGPQGNANVKVDTFTITNAQWTWNSVYAFQTVGSSYTEYFTRYYDAAFASVTQGLLDTGMVMAYFTSSPLTNVNQWSPLPYQFTDGSGSFTYNLVFETRVGSVRFHYFFVQLNTTTATPTLSTFPIPTYKFKLVAVAGSIVTQMKQEHIDVHDYNAVSRFTGLWQTERTDKARTIDN